MSDYHKPQSQRFYIYSASRVETIPESIKKLLMHKDIKHMPKDIKSLCMWKTIPVTKDQIADGNHDQESW